MKFHWTFLLLASVVLAGTSCHKGSDSAENAAPYAPVGPVKLKLKWPPGQRIVQTVDWTVQMDCSGPSLPEDVPQKATITMGQKLAMTVLKDLPKGGHQVEMEFLSARLAVETNGQNMANYDSEVKTNGNDAMADVFQKIVGSKIDFYLNASNDLDRIDGVDELKAKMSRVKGLSASLDDIFGKSYFKQMMSSSLFLPSRAVAPGDSWPVQMEVFTESLGTVDFTYTITLKGWENHGSRTCARLEFQGDIKRKPGEMVIVSGGSVAIQNGATSGVFWFDPESNMVIDTDMKQDLTTLISFAHTARHPNSPDTESGPMTLTNHLTQTMNLKMDVEKP